MKSKLEIRKFAVEKAVVIMGTGIAVKDVIAKAKEIELYVLGDAVLPETYNDNESLMGVFNGALSALNTLSGSK